MIDVASHKPHGMRRHRQPHVVAQQSGQRVDIGSLVRVHIALEQRSVQLRGSAGRAPQEPPLRADAPSAPAVPAGARSSPSDAHSSSRGRLLGRPAEHVAQDQHRPLARRQMLNRGQERQFDRLLGDGGVRLGIVARPAPVSGRDTAGARDLVGGGSAAREACIPTSFLGGSGRRGWSRKSRQALVAIRYSQARNVARPLN